MRIGTEDPWALTELAKAGGAWGGWGVPPSRHFCLSVPWFVKGHYELARARAIADQFIYAIYTYCGGGH